MNTQSIREICVRFIEALELEVPGESAQKVIIDLLGDYFTYEDQMRSSDEERAIQAFEVQPQVLLQLDERLYECARARALFEQITSIKLSRPPEKGN